jgi:hypothetical protein
VLGRAASARSSARTVDGLVLPLLSALVASAVAFLLALRMATTVIAIAATAASSVVVYVLLLGVAVAIAPRQRFVAPITEAGHAVLSGLRQRGTSRWPDRIGPAPAVISVSEPLPSGEAVRR